MDKTRASLALQSMIVALLAVIALQLAQPAPASTNTVGFNNVTSQQVDALSQKVDALNGQVVTLNEQASAVNDAIGALNEHVSTGNDLLRAGNDLLRAICKYTGGSQVPILGLSPCH